MKTTISLNVGVFMLENIIKVKSLSCIVVLYLFYN